MCQPRRLSNGVKRHKGKAEHTTTATPTITRAAAQVPRRGSRVLDATAKGITLKAIRIVPIYIHIIIKPELLAISAVK